MAKKNKQQIKFEADITGLKKGIKEGEESIRSLTKELRLNQEQLKGNRDNTDLLTKRLNTLQEQYDKQIQVVEQCNEAYEKAKEDLGENSDEAKKWKDRLVEAETKQQKIKNAIDETNKELKTQTDRLITNGKKWEETGEHITKLGDKINSLGNKLSVVSAGTAGIATVALKSSIDYESAFTGVRKTVDGTEEQLQSIRQGILDMSTELPSAATEIAAVAESAGQLGIKTDDILSFTRVMIDLGESTNLSSNEAASSLAKFANVTGMSADKYSNLGSVVVALGNNFATTESDIVEMGTRLAASGELAGLTEAQIMALATSMSSVGIEAEAGGSAMSKLLKKMQVATETGSKDLNEFAKVAGMTSKDFKKAFQEDAVEALSKFISGLNDTERNGKSAVALLDEMGIKDVRLSNTILSLANSSDVMTNAIDLANKSWNDNTALSKEASTRYKTTESQLKMLKNEATKTAIEFGDELAPSLRQVLKDCKPLLTNISDAIKKFSQLDDKTKQNVIRLGALVVTLGPVTKAVGGLTSTLGTGIKGVGNFAQAIGNLKNGTDTGSESVKELTGILKSFASPAGVVVGGTIAVAGLTTALMMLNSEEIEACNQAKKLADEMANEKKELDEYNKSIDDATNAELARLDSVSGLKDKLAELADENGKVDEKNRGRVEFILNELNEALGTEYKLNGDVIDSYKQLQDEIQGTIDKEKARIILNAKKEKYAKAVQDNEKYTEEASKTRDAISQKGFSPQQLASLLRQYDDINIRGHQVTQSEYEKLIQQLGTNSNDEIKALKNLVKAYDDSLYNLKVTTEAKMDYERTYSDFVDGNYEKINNTVTVKTENYSKKSLNELKNSLFEQQNELKKYEEIYKKTGDEISAANIEQSKKNIQTLREEMANRLATVDTYGKEEIMAWGYLANNSVEMYASALQNLPDETVREIQNATGRVVSDEQLEEAFRKLGRESVDGFKNNNFEKTGQDAAQSIANGVNSKMGLFATLSQRISQKLKITPTVASPVNGGHADGLAYVPFNNYVARLHEGERVLTKKENQDYTRNINNNSQNVVVNIYPQQMTEQEMIKVSNFIEREWGRRS